MQTIIKRIITGIILSALFLSIFLYLPPWVMSLALLAIMGEIVVAEFPKLLNPHKWAFWTLVPIYPVLPFIFLILMNQDPTYHILFLVLIILVSLHDTGSYFVGNLVGRHKIAPHISPSKTWEGFIGGYVVSCAGMLGLRWYSTSSISIIILACLVLLFCVISLLGDLFESWLKRRAHIKDSANLLPGHGGFLDRFDGILFVAYFFYLLKDFLVAIVHLQ